MSKPRITALRTPPVAIALIAGDKRIAETMELEDVAVESFDTVESMLEYEGELTFSVLVLRVESTVSSLPRWIESLSQRFDVPLVLACEQIERWEVRTALAAGAAGVVTDEDLHRTLGPCLQAVMTGQVCVPRAQWRQVEPPALSAREKQVLGLVVMGYMNSQIAEQLFLAESTVKSHLSSAFGKLGVRSRNEAVNLILDPERGLGMGILALGGERLDSPMAAVQ
jgi:DNA-binding NarL/FixJ family response regulator